MRLEWHQGSCDVSCYSATNRFCWAGSALERCRHRGLRAEPVCNDVDLLLCQQRRRMSATGNLGPKLPAGRAFSFARPCHGAADRSLPRSNMFGHWIASQYFHKLKLYSRPGRNARAMPG